MILSHYKPDKSLKTHIQEVEKAAHRILSLHSEQIQSVMKEWIYYTVLFHDLGKAINEFQKYIKDPIHYKGKKKDKSHTPVSFYWWCSYFQFNNIDSLTAIAVSTVVWKHHGNFPLFSGISGLEYALSSHYNLIQKQLENYPKKQIEKIIKLNLPENNYDALLDITDFLYENRPGQLTIPDAALFRLKVQFLFSILLEADRVFLALYDDHLKHYFTQQPFNLPVSLVDIYLKTKQSSELTEFNNYRHKIRNKIIEKNCSNISTITLPTGMGKTMIAAAWALKYRKPAGQNKERKVIVILPYLSIIDQTVKEYKKLLNSFDTDKIILEAHSLAERKYCEDAEEEERQLINNSIDFLQDIWNKPFIVTTFDQFLLTLFSSKGSHQLRFHNLADSLIIMDEIQAVPALLWKPLSIAINSLAENFNSKILIMSATQPGFIDTACELVEHPAKVFANRNRYKIVLRHKKKLVITDFINECKNRIKKEWKNKRVMIVLNTRASARLLLDSLVTHTNIPVYFLSADVIPQERLENILKIKDNKPCLVIATQCVEAGVDIDMDFIIRDFAPLDSIIQVAGRCNRNGIKQRCTVELVKLVNENGNYFFSYVYKDNILIGKTIEVLNSCKNDEMLEEEIYPLVVLYYQLIKEKKDTGKKYMENWIFWQDEINVKKLLRGDDAKVNFVVIKKDKPKETELPLKKAIENAINIEDRWERKRNLKALSGRIAKLTVSIWATKDFEPELIADKIGPWLLLKDEFYETGRGIDIKNPVHSALIL